MLGRWLIENLGGYDYWEAQWIMCACSNIDLHRQGLTSFGFSTTACYQNYSLPRVLYIFLLLFFILFVVTAVWLWLCHPPVFFIMESFPSSVFFMFLPFLSFSPVSVLSSLLRHTAMTFELITIFVYFTNPLFESYKSVNKVTCHQHCYCYPWI